VAESFLLKHQLVISSRARRRERIRRDATGLEDEDTVARLRQPISGERAGDA